MTIYRIKTHPVPSPVAQAAHENQVGPVLHVIVEVPDDNRLGQELHYKVETKNQLPAYMLLPRETVN